MRVYVELLLGLSTLYNGLAILWEPTIEKRIASVIATGLQGLALYAVLRGLA